jgi:hypothetical protein
MSWYIIRQHSWVVTIAAGVVLKHFKVYTDMKADMAFIMDGYERRGGFRKVILKCVHCRHDLSHTAHYIGRIQVIAI